MKYLILLILAYTQFTFAQQNTDLSNQFKSYIEATNSLNPEKTYNLTYPAIFEKITVSMLKDMYKNLSENPNFKLVTNSTNTKPIFGQVIEYGGRNFVKIISENEVEMLFKQPISNPEIMSSDFKISMNAKSVVYDKKNNSFKIIHDIVVVGVRDESTKKTWKFINFSPRKNAIADLFGQEVSKQLKL